MFMKRNKIINLRIYRTMKIFNKYNQIKISKIKKVQIKLKANNKNQQSNLRKEEEKIKLKIYDVLLFYI